MRRVDQDDYTSSENNALITNKRSNKKTKNIHIKHAKTYKFTGKCYKCSKIEHT